ncbi:hypothetical protein HMPREF0454_04043 [Hafnia alvei ATCC 51873]|uniref:Uncharacterized protein n=1 Tax=Hafnia alvei ATCC 51873 TaxID=1002364 RepID=G9YBL4_HAFAL|nr:hypothetical protein HMPREF0454_04043 [Hafnia alvei ATCC 51873]
MADKIHSMPACVKIAGLKRPSREIFLVMRCANIQEPTYS